MRATWRAVPTLVAACMWLGCSEPSSIGVIHQEEAVQNGVMLNGIMLNGIMLNGIMLNGIMLNGIMLNGQSLSSLDQYVRRSGARLGGVSLSPLVTDGGLSATTPDGTQLRGADLIGAQLQGVLGSWTLPLRIDDAVADTTPGNDDITLYDVSVRLAGHSYPLCGTDASGAAIHAVAVGGRWNYGIGSSGGAHIDDPKAFTFGCVEDAIGKCARLGYKPWDQRLQPYHQACTRMVRADYCGDGRSHTVDGTWINVYDGLGIQTDDEPWYFEAEWNDSGAVCVSHQRVLDLTTVPDCAARVTNPTCGDLSHFGTGTLLMDEYQTQPKG